MVFHVIALPHSQTTKEFSACAFNEKVRKFCNMMTSLGHQVYLYAGEQNEAKVTEHFVCITEEERVACLNGKHYTQASFDYTLPHWRKFNQRVIQIMKLKIQPKDFICVIGGLAHKEVADAFPNNMTVEFGIGYSGTFAPYRVFESYAWMHSVYGQQQGAQSAQGIWFDDVIPSYFEMEDFPFSDKKDDYYLFIGRLADDKGYKIAIDVCKKLGKRLILAGPGEAPEYGHYVGVVSPKKRAQLMKNATAVFVPSTYLEPFGSVAVEAQLCGTPVITTDWGAFTEIVVQGITGFRCRTFKEFCEAAEDVKKLTPQAIRKIAEMQYSVDVIKLKYQRYFERLMTLWDKGWYAE